MLYQARRAGCKTLLINARLSEKSARGYDRFRRLTREMLDNLDIIAAQGQADADRFIGLGAKPERVKAIGSLKFHQLPASIADDTAPEYFASLQTNDRNVMIAASTREGEEAHVLRAFSRCLEAMPGLLLILVPRHPERFDAVAELCQQNNLHLARRSLSQNLDAETAVMLGDSMGEMQFYFQLADVAFVGGSLVDTGCHNVIEPAAMGLPVLVGPSQFNFQAICQSLERAGALRTVADADELARQTLLLLNDDVARKKMSDAGKESRPQESGGARTHYGAGRFLSRFRNACLKSRIARQIDVTPGRSPIHCPRFACHQRELIRR